MAWISVCRLLIAAALLQTVFSNVVDLNDHNFEATMTNNKLVIINFYANWCRFSQMLTPVFEEAARKIAEEFKEGVALGRVDCEGQLGLAQRFSINKYPTLKVFRNGQALKKEYRGQRSPEAFLEYVRGELSPSLKNIEEHELSESISKRSIVGYFPHTNGAEYAAFDKAASVQKDDCQFLSIVRDGAPVAIGVHSERSVVAEHTYDGDHSDHGSIMSFVTDRCVPLVREITFANAEGLTEEGLPFLILFHQPDDSHALQVFEDQVRKELLPLRNTVNFIHADGEQFSHPLHHLGKSKQDLPVLAIDSFRHMYLFSSNFHEDVRKPGKLKQFVEDLHSGKLHREFHYGPDPTEHPQVEQAAPSIDQGPDVPHLAKSDPPQPSPSSVPDLEDLGREHQFRGPPKSAFAKLAPGKNRYTFAGQHDEL